MSEKEPIEKEYTAEELQEMQKKTLDFYESQTVILTAQCKVEELRARINKARYKAVRSNVQLLQLNMALEKQDETETSDSPKAD